jgi:hypothetical protein
MFDVQIKVAECRVIAASDDTQKVAIRSLEQYQTTAVSRPDEESLWDFAWIFLGPAFLRTTVICGVSLSNASFFRLDFAGQAAYLSARK